MDQSPQHIQIQRVDRRRCEAHLLLLSRMSIIGTVSVTASVLADAVGVVHEDDKEECFDDEEEGGQAEGEVGGAELLGAAELVGALEDGEDDALDEVEEDDQFEGKKFGLMERKWSVKWFSYG